MIHSFGTDRSGKIVQTQIRLLPEEQSDQFLLLFAIPFAPFWQNTLRVGLFCLNIKITAKFSGIPKLRNFMVNTFSCIYRAKVTITDLPEFVPLMRLNVDANKHLCKYPVSAEALRWGEEVSSRFSNVDIILIADCIYYEEVRGLSEYMSRNVRKPTMWILTRSDTNQAVQPLKMARGLKFWI